MVGCFQEFEGQDGNRRPMALKPENSLPRDKYTKYSVFQREFYSWYSKTSEERLPGLVEAAQARGDVKPPRITCDLRSRNSTRLEDRRRASTELKKKFTSTVYKALVYGRKGRLGYMANTLTFTSLILRMTLGI